MVPKSLLGLALLGAAVCAACSAGGSTSSAPQPMLPPAPGPTDAGPVEKHIAHVVVIVQENRTFENFFAGYPGADAPTYGYAATKHGRRKINLRAITFDGPDLRHDLALVDADWDNGKMDGFDQFGTKNPHNGPNPAYTYVERRLIAPYWTMAQQYVLADHMFPTEFGRSFTGHLTLIAGTDNLTPTKAEVDFPTQTPDDCDSPPGTISAVVGAVAQSQFRRALSVLHSVQYDSDDARHGGSLLEVLRNALLDGGMW